MALSCCSSQPQQTQLPFNDDFTRPDTNSGLGEGWDMRGPYVDKFPLPPAQDGFLRDDAFTYAGNAVVYATKEFDRPVHRMRAEGRWRSLRRPGAETTLAMAISANDKLVSDMIHFVANRSVWKLTVRRGADFLPVAEGRFSPILKVGEKYAFEIEAEDREVTVRVPGHVQKTVVDVSSLIGPYVFWEEYPMKTPAGTVFDFDSVAAS
ncbi:hypothetical protein EB72_15475 [Mycobacterium sp. SWH-M1]|nr:hypothetical protein EB72_15475 [Mycobacterium sp. SWH-M1]